MALPTLTKTWQFNVNNAQAAQGTAKLDNQLWMYNVKNALTGFGTNPWTVVGSSDSVTAGIDGVDRITASSKWVFSTNSSPHSWIVLKQTGIGSNAQLLITCSTNDSTNCNIWTMRFSPSVGFTGGGTNGDPSATDSFTFVNAVGIGVGTSDATCRWSVMQSTDGQCTRFFLFVAGTLQSFVCIEKFANPTGGTPGASNSGYCLGGTGTITAFSGGFTSQNGVSTSCSLSYESAANFGIASEVDGQWDIFPMGIVGTSVGARGKLGTLQDIWKTSSGIAQGDSFPATGSPLSQFVVIGSSGANNIVLPWNNGAFNLT